MDEVTFRLAGLLFIGWSMLLLAYAGFWKQGRPGGRRGLLQFRHSQAEPQPRNGHPVHAVQRGLEILETFQRHVKPHQMPMP